MNDVKAALLSVCIALVLGLPDESSANGLKRAGATQLLQEAPKGFEASEHDAPPTQPRTAGLPKHGAGCPKHG